MARDMETLELVSRLEGHRGFELLKEEAQKKVQGVEQSLTRLLFNTSAEVSPTRVEYDRGFKQGVRYALQGLPHEIQVEFKKRLADKKVGNE